MKAGDFVLENIDFLLGLRHEGLNFVDIDPLQKQRVVIGGFSDQKQNISPICQKRMIVGAN